MAEHHFNVSFLIVINNVTFPSNVLIGSDIMSKVSFIFDFCNHKSFIKTGNNYIEFELYTTRKPDQFQSDDDTTNTGRNSWSVSNHAFQESSEPQNKGPSHPILV